MPVVATKERGIIFTPDSVKAILSGDKTQSRRVMKNIKLGLADIPLVAMMRERWYFLYLDFDGVSGLSWRPAGGGPTVPWPQDRMHEVCPYGGPGDRLYVKENAYIAPLNFGTEDTAHPSDIKIDRVGNRRIVTYSASMSSDAKRCAQEYGVKQTSSLFLPRWASRLTLELIEVRVERLQDITEEDAKAEGLVPLDGGPEDEDDRDWSICPRCSGLRIHNALGANYGVIFDVDCTGCDTYRKRFRHRWDHINGKKPGCAWVDSPYVWCLSFRRVEEQR